MCLSLWTSRFTGLSLGDQFEAIDTFLLSTHQLELTLDELYSPEAQMAGQPLPLYGYSPFLTLASTA